MNPSKPTLLIHGGAWRIMGDHASLHKKALRKALSCGWEVLLKNGNALDAVEQTVKNMEDSGVFDAGKGSVLNANGEMEMDALIMTGGLKAGAVAGLKNFRNPISIAKAVMEKTQHMLLMGKGAADFAKSAGFEETPLLEMVTERELRSWQKRTIMRFGTVGALALDKEGGLAAGTSTGGTRNKMVGRVGDSPLIGSGAYCDSETGAASATGHGESFMKIVACKTACDLLKTERTAQLAAQKTISLLERRTGGRGGIILLRKDGDIGIAFNTPRMARAYMSGRMRKPFVEV